jgi:mannose-6-phosphate isomerase-like protein (cupin superfamily)
MTENHDYQCFRPNEIARSFPETSETLLMDTYLTDEAAASARVFRVCRETPPHYHASCDEYLYVLSGRGTFWMGDASNGGEFAPGDLLFFKRSIVHALPKILEEPVIFLSFDTPRRDQKDIIFVNPPGRHAGELYPRNGVTACPIFLPKPTPRAFKRSVDSQATR